MRGTNGRGVQGCHQIQTKGQKSAPPSRGSPSIAAGVGQGNVCRSPVHGYAEGVGFRSIPSRTMYKVPRIWPQQEGMQDVCAHCWGNHVKPDFPQWSDRENSVPRRINCFKATNDKAEHSAFERSCPVRTKWDEIARSRVSYC